MCVQLTAIAIFIIFISSIDIDRPFISSGPHQTLLLHWPEKHCLEHSTLMPHPWALRGAVSKYTTNLHSAIRGTSARRMGSTLAQHSNTTNVIEFSPKNHELSLSAMPSGFVHITYHHPTLPRRTRLFMLSRPSTPPSAGCLLYQPTFNNKPSKPSVQSSNSTCTNQVRRYLQGCPHGSPHHLQE